MITPLTLATVVVVTSLATALTALLLLSAIGARRKPGPKRAELFGDVEQAVFLFDGQDLVDATRAGHALLNVFQGKGSEWQKLSAFIAQRLPEFEEEIATLPARGQIEIAGSADSGLSVQAEAVGAMTRLTVIDLASQGSGVLVDGLSHRAQARELEELRDTLAELPIMVWRTDAAGCVVSANTAYLEGLAESAGVGEDELTWPLPRLFAPDVSLAGPAPRRQRLAIAGGKSSRWYECHSVDRTGGALHFAQPADAIVKAETALREFVQTLTKTFAHLPVGLAIFDRQRNLALFNPALVDLTSLGVEFLSARPTLFAFLDRLREARVIPEPKDYSVWRQKMAALELAAASDLYEDTWSLPSGQTYKVTGRPHPDGAVAFLIEDISAEISLTRRFRSEIELGQEVVDTLDEAVAVFSPAGDLVLSNAAFGDLWGMDPGTALGRATIMDCVRFWQTETAPNPFWGELLDFVTDIGERAEWYATVTRTGGASIAVRVVPMSGRTTLVGFDRVVNDRPTVRRTRRPHRSEASGAMGDQIHV